VKLKLAAQLGQELSHPEFGEAELTLSEACGNSAREALTLFRELALTGVLEGVAWLDVYYAYHGVMVLSMDFLYRSNNEDSAEDLARRAVVREVLNVARSFRLCHTFQVLAHVAAQFAKVVDVFDDTVLDGRPAADDQARHARGIPQAPGSQEPRYQPEGGTGLGNSVFVQRMPDATWDFVDLWGDTFNETLAGAPYQEVTMSGLDRFGMSSNLSFEYVGFNVDNNV